MLCKIQSFKTFFSPSIFFKIYDHDFLAFITVDVLLHSTLNIANFWRRSNLTGLFELMVAEMLQKSKFSLYKCFIFMLYQVFFLLYISYLFYVFYCIFVIYLYAVPDIYVMCYMFKFFYVFLFSHYLILNLCDNVFIFIICIKLL